MTDFTLQHSLKTMLQSNQNFEKWKNYLFY